MRATTSHSRRDSAWISAGLAGLIVALAASPSPAVPVFARKYQTSCQTCHTVFPKLNPHGEAFRLNGYRMSGQSEDMVKEEPVSLGAEAYKKIWPKAVSPGDIPGHVPIAINIKMADLYVMPAVSEPFGIAPLEAMSHDVPVIISKQSGVSEVLNHVLKVDFWDVDEMANKIVAVLKHPPLASMLRQHGAFEVKKLSWSDAAKRCVEVYDKVVEKMTGATAPEPKKAAAPAEPATPAAGQTRIA